MGGDGVRQLSYSKWRRKCKKKRRPLHDPWALFLSLAESRSVGFNTKAYLMLLPWPHLSCQFVQRRSLRTVTVTTESGGRRLFVETAVPYFRWVQASHACQSHPCKPALRLFSGKWKLFLAFRFSGHLLFHNCILSTGINLKECWIWCERSLNTISFFSQIKM